MPREDFYERDLVRKMPGQLARNIRKRRLLLGQSQFSVTHHLSQVYGFKWHQTVIAKIESGERAVKVDEAYALCKFFGIDLDDLVRGRNLDMISNAHVALDVTEGHVSVSGADRSLTGDPDGELVSIDRLIADARNMVMRGGGQDDG